MDAITYEAARELVRRRAGDNWTGKGVFCLDDRTIIENDEMYVFKVGAWEFLVQGKRDYLIAGAVPVVHKADGRMEWLNSAAVGMDPTIRIRENPDPTLRVYEGQ